MWEKKMENHMSSNGNALLLLGVESFSPVLSSFLGAKIYAYNIQQDWTRTTSSTAKNKGWYLYG